MSTSLDSKDWPICPHCLNGCKDWQFTGEGLRKDDGDSWEIVCDSCGRTYSVTIHVDLSFSMNVAEKPTVELREGMVICEGTLLPSEVVFEMVWVAEWIAEMLVKANKVEEADAINEMCENMRRRFTKDNYNETEDAMQDWEEVMDLLQEFAPEGCLVGGHEGDPACIGVWRVEE